MLVLLAGLVVAQLVSFAIHMHERGELLLQASGVQSAQRIADIVRLLESSNPAERRKIVSVLSAPPLGCQPGPRPDHAIRTRAARSSARAALVRHDVASVSRR